MCCRTLDLPITWHDKNGKTAVSNRRREEIALFGLVKAVDRFNPEKSTKLGAYIGKVLDNEFLQELRYRRRRRAFFTAKSFEDVIFDDGENSITLKDTIADPNDPYEHTENLMHIRQMWEKAGLKENEKKAIYFTIIEGLNQTEAGEAAGISQSIISRCVRSGASKMCEWDKKNVRRMSE